MEGDSRLQMQRVWQRLGEGVDPFGEESPSRLEGGFVRASSRDGPLCLPQSPALPSPHICTPTATWRDRWLLPSLGCQFKLLNKAFAKSTPCSSGSLWLIEERPNSSSVFLDNVSSSSSLTHNRPVPGNIHHSAHMPRASLCASHTALRRFFLPSLCCSCPSPPRPAPHPPPRMPFFLPTLMLPNHLCLQESPDRSRRTACSCPALNLLCDTVAQPDLVLETKVSLLRVDAPGRVPYDMALDTIITRDL